MICAISLSPKIVWISVTNKKLRGPVTIFGSSEPRKFLHILRRYERTFEGMCEIRTFVPSVQAHIKSVSILTRK